MAKINGKQADAIFSEFFGGMDLGGGQGSRAVPVQPDNLFSHHFVGSGGDSGSSTVRKGTAIERTLPCSLEDLYKGTTKKMKISREVVDPSTGRLKAVEEIISIEIKRGWKKGTRITFPGKGNERGGPAVDLVFITFLSDVCWVRSLLTELRIKVHLPMRLYCDNKAAIYIASNPVFYERTKHIEIDCHFIRDKVQEGLITTPYTPSHEQTVDIFTKALRSNLFHHHLRKLGMCDIYSPT